MIALLETLISTRMCDGMTGRVSSEKKEVFGCGIANVVTGLAGGLGTNAALARTLLNIDAGATSRLSGIVNGAITMILCTALFPYFRYLPLPIVAAVLVAVSVRMVSAKAWRDLYATDRGACAIALLVTIVSVVADPAIGVASGTLCTILRHMWELRRGPATVRLLVKGRDDYEEVASFRFDGRSESIRLPCVGRPPTNDEQAMFSFATQLRSIMKELAAAPVEINGPGDSNNISELVIEATPVIVKVFPSAGDASDETPSASLRLEYTFGGASESGHMPFIAAEAHRRRLRCLLTVMTEPDCIASARGLLHVSARASAAFDLERSVYPGAAGSICDTERPSPALLIDGRDPPSKPPSVSSSTAKNGAVVSSPLLEVSARLGSGEQSDSPLDTGARQVMEQAVRESNETLAFKLRPR